MARPDALRRVLGYLPQDFGVYPQPHRAGVPRLPRRGQGLAGPRRARRVDELLELVNLDHAAQRPLGGYSGGMLRRVGIAQALLADPRVIVVDEPTAGLDPEERVRFRNLLSDLAADRVVLLSTHIVSDVESVASDIAVVAGGRMRRRGSPEELLREVDGQRLGGAWPPPADVAEVQARHVVTRLVRTAGRVRMRLLADAPAVPGRDAGPPRPGGRLPRLVDPRMRPAVEVVRR